jgi:hypothetical protein
LSCTGNSGEAWILIEFREPVDISEIEIQSGFSAFPPFPRSFDFIVTEANGKMTRMEIRDAKLKGKHNSERYRLDSQSVRSVKIEQKGPGWNTSQSERFIQFRRERMDGRSREISNGLKLIFLIVNSSLIRTN